MHYAVLNAGLVAYIKGTLRENGFTVTGFEKECNACVRLVRKAVFFYPLL